jgi:hypothetical protein
MDLGRRRRGLGRFRNKVRIEQEARSQLNLARLAFRPSKNSTIFHVRHRAQKIYQSHNRHPAILSFNANLRKQDIWHWHESDAKTHRTPQHFVQNEQRAYLISRSFGSAHASSRRFFETHNDLSGLAWSAFSHRH